MAKTSLFKNILLGGGVFAAAAFAFAGVKADRLARIGAGYKAKITCSEIFVAGRDAQTVIKSEFEGIDPLMRQIIVTVDPDDKIVKAAGPLGFGRATAIFRQGYGCTLANGGRIRPLPEIAQMEIEPAPWPEAPPVSGRALDWVDYAALDHALADAFENNEPNHRAVLVAVDGKIIDERYAAGFDRNTPFLSWSAAKSVTATLVGAAAHHGYLNVNNPAPVPEWKPDDERSQITWNNLLHMQSGLAFEEKYDVTRSDVNRMLFEAPDAGGAAAKKELEYQPGEHWAYSSGTSNLLARTLSQTLNEQGVEFYQFARENLLHPIGAASVVLEPDAAGYLIGSSFVYATARDWARLGQLYLQDGVWNGERLLPEGWADYVAEPASASNGQYGAHFWLNHNGGQRSKFMSGLPEDIYFMSGHEGQYVFIIPSKRMVIVRTGMTRGQNPFPAVAPLITAIYDAVGTPPQQTSP